MSEKQASWTRFSDTTKADLPALEAEERLFSAGLAGRVLEYMQRLGQPCNEAMPLTALEHCRQTASRAHRDGRDEEYVVCALLHDIGEHLATMNHGDFAAAILKPYVSAENHWMLEHHPIFQGHYFFEHLGLDPNARERYREHPYYQRAVDFCALYDQVSFDPAYESLPLEFFAPMVQRVLAPPRAEAGQHGPLAMQEVMSGD